MRPSEGFFQDNPVIFTAQQENHRQRPVDWMVLQASKNLDPAKLREVDIQEDERRLWLSQIPAFHVIQRFLPITSNQDRIRQPGAAKFAFCEIDIDRIIIYKQDRDIHGDFRTHYTMKPINPR